jgi:RimJ/RimL family protein N-acetyltransferase
MSYLIPEHLETERLSLRMFKETDWQDLYEYFSDPECTRYTTRRPLNEHESRQKLTGLIEHWDVKGYGSYAMQEKSLGTVIGVVGLDYPSDWPEPEIQWGLARKYWGLGYASESVRVIKHMTKQFLPDLPLISLIHPENIHSINLAKAVGAVFEKKYFFRDDTWDIFRH